MNPHVMNSHGMSSHVVSSQRFFPFVWVFIFHLSPIIIIHMEYVTQKEYLILIQTHLAKSGGARVSIIQWFKLLNICLKNFKP